MRGSQTQKLISISTKTIGLYGISKCKSSSNSARSRTMRMEPSLVNMYHLIRVDILYNKEYGVSVIVVPSLSTTEIILGRGVSCNTSHAMWNSLAAVHESHGHQTIFAFVQNLIETKAKKGENIMEHVIQLKKYWECINLIGNKDFQFLDAFFKLIITSLLPPS